MRSPRSVATGVSFLLVGGALAIAGLEMLLERNEFKSAAMVRVNSYPPMYSSAYFLFTEFEVFKSPPVLSNVVDSLGLNERWSKKYNHGQRLGEAEIEERIKRRLDLRNIRKTQLIEVSMLDEDPYEAAQLANRIAGQYRQVRMEQFSRMAAGNTNVPAKFVPVDIMDSAVPQMRPVRPNRYLASMMLGCGMFLMILGMVSLGARRG